MPDRLSLDAGAGPACRPAAVSGPDRRDRGQGCGAVRRPVRRCDADHLAGMVTDDFEFFHDKDGQSATSGAQFIQGIRAMCERQRTGVDYRARRELIAGSLQVYPINNYGAVELGEHRFYKLEAGGKERLVEVSKFVNLWKRVDGRWRLSRVISYGHTLTN
ncbi:MAG: nuclear transport factor 2 family protein [Proteobacteria bacterium]|nr:nuclear transport factor 2 family protein [Pseudomonadota bacterium]